MAKRKLPAQPPYFKFYPADYLGGVMGAGMTCEQMGFYIAFLCLQWRAFAALPDDAPALARQLKQHLKHVRRLLEEVVALGPKKITRQGGVLFNPRLMREIRGYQRAQAKRAASTQGLLPLPPTTLAQPAVFTTPHSLPTGQSGRLGKTAQSARRTRS